MEQCCRTIIKFSHKVCIGVVIFSKYVKLSKIYFRFPEES